MFKKFMIIIIGLAAYVYFVDSDRDFHFRPQASQFYGMCCDKIKDMDLKIYVNKWSYNQPKKRSYYKKRSSK
ncbi:MAG TPA: hypothetical protein P5048_01015 [Chlamydiales bacterium]|nr:hypothetical protein [Chlamydiales bacterium]